MNGHINTTGISEAGDFTPIPKGEYYFDIAEIGESTTKNNDPMAKLTLIVNQGEYINRRVFDNIIIPSPSSPGWGIVGRTKRFLHAIGEPYEGEFKWDTNNWLHKSVKAGVKHEIQKEGKNAGQPKAVITHYILDDNPTVPTQTQTINADDIVWKD